MDTSTIATEEDLKNFGSMEQKKLDGKIRGVLVEIATTGILRYPWNLLIPVLTSQIEYVLRDYHAEEQVEIGPSRPLPANETLEDCITRLSGILQCLKEAPFTIQRLAELLLEPKGQYVRLDKIAFALEKLISVTTTIPKTYCPPEAPSLGSFPAVNQNPTPVFFKQLGSSALFDGYVEQHPSTTNGSINGEDSEYTMNKSPGNTTINETLSVQSVSDGDVGSSIDNNQIS